MASVTCWKCQFPLWVSCKLTLTPHKILIKDKYKTHKDPEDNMLTMINKMLSIRASFLVPTLPSPFYCSGLCFFIPGFSWRIKISSRCFSPSPEALPSRRAGKVSRPTESEERGKTQRGSTARFLAERRLWAPVVGRPALHQIVLIPASGGHNRLLPMHATLCLWV